MTLKMIQKKQIEKERREAMKARPFIKRQIDFPEFHNVSRQEFEARLAKFTNAAGFILEDHKVSCFYLF